MDIQFPCNTNGIREGFDIWLLQFSIIIPGPVPLIPRIALSSKLIRRRAEGQLTICCEMANIILEIHFTNYFAVELYAEIIHFTQLSRMTWAKQSEAL